MHTFVCIVGLPYILILVCGHDIICVYVCLCKCTNEIDVLSTNSIPTWGSINVIVMVMVISLYFYLNIFEVR